MAANWEDLHSDILYQIISRITTFYDNIRISGVCPSWRIIAMQMRSTLSHPTPGLMITPTKTSKKRKFFSLYQNPSSFSSPKYVSLNVRRNHRCCGSYKGWLVLISEEKERECTSFYLLNPFMKRRKVLPKLEGCYKVEKAVLSCLPSRGSNCVVFVICENRGAVFCRLRDNSWTKFEFNEISISDALFFLGRFYVVDDHGVIYTCNLRRRCFKELLHQPRDNSEFTRKWYLVEVKGELCRVMRNCRTNDDFYYDIDDDDHIDDDDDYATSNAKDGSCVSTRGFRVWKMDSKTKEWVRVEDLGDYALFLGRCNSMGVSELLVNGIKGNRIYFTDDRHRTKHLGFDFPGEDMGVFCLEDSSMKPLSSKQCEWVKNSPVTWVCPLPW